MQVRANIPRTPPLRCGLSMHPPPPVQPALQGRDWRGRLMEETMLPLTLDDLLYLTRDELCRLAVGLEDELDVLEAGTVARLNILVSLDNIHRAMFRRGFRF